MGRFHTVTVKPTVPASKQASGVFNTGRVVFDWTEFDIPKGANRLYGLTALLRGTNGARQEFAMDYYFAKTINNVAPGSLGVINAGANGTGYQNHLLGHTRHVATDVSDGLDIMAISDDSIDFYPGILQGEPDSGTNVGYDKIYIAGIAVTASLPDFRSAVTCTGVQATTQANLICGTTSCLTNFDKGDVLHDENDRALGTVKSLTNANLMVMEENLANETVNAKDIYNINPITLKLHFEK